MSLVSLKKTVTELDRLDDLFQSSAASLRGVLRTLANHTLEIDLQAAEQLRSFLAAALEQLRAGELPEGFESVRAGFEREWPAFAAASHSRFELICRELSATVRALDEALTSAGNEIPGGAETALKNEIQQLRALSTVSDLTALLAGIRKCAANLESCLEAFRAERQRLVTQLKDEIRTLQAHLDAAKKEAQLDPVTGILNRRELERQIAEALEKKVRFSLMYIWLANYKYLERDLPQKQADALITSIVAAMRALLPAGTALGRWSDDEFYALLFVDKPTAIQASRELTFRLNGNFELGGGAASVKLRAGIGVVEARPNEDAAAFLKRGRELTNAIQGRG
jgi:GGDEF domain-containing protein